MDYWEGHGLPQKSRLSPNTKPDLSKELLKLHHFSLLSKETSPFYGILSLLLTLNQWERLWHFYLSFEIGA